MIRIALLAVWAFVLGASALPGETWERLDRCEYVQGAHSDGDSIEVRPQGKHYVFRLYFVDCVEKNPLSRVRRRGQARYFGLNGSERTALRAAYLASNFTRDKLREPFTIYTRWQAVEPDGDNPAVRAFVETAQGEDLSTLLVREGVGTFPKIAADAPWTTVGHWYGYPALEWEGRRYGGKRESLVQMRSLPQELQRPCVIATDLAPDWHDYGPFAEAGWRFLPTSEVCRNVCSYLSFIAQSRGEIGIAKEGYVVSRAGWMSDRSVVYLALSRPVVLQDTGWTHAIAPSHGLLAFRDTRDCADTIRSIEADYETHSRAAQELSRTIFSPEGTLKPLLEKNSLVYFVERFNFQVPGSLRCSFLRCSFKGHDMKVRPPSWRDEMTRSFRQRVSRREKTSHGIL